MWGQPGGQVRQSELQWAPLQALLQWELLWWGQQWEPTGLWWGLLSALWLWGRLRQSELPWDPPWVMHQWGLPW